MVIDLILDRKDFDKMLQDNKINLQEYKKYYYSLSKEEQQFRFLPYNARNFYYNVLNYYQTFRNDLHENILKALDYGTNKDIQKALCDYILQGGYNPSICDYINNVNWLEE